MYFVSGIILEELKYSSKSSMSFCNEDVVSYYDHAGDAFLSMLQSNESKSSLTRIQSPSDFQTKCSTCAGQPLEVALQRSTIINISQG